MHDAAMQAETKQSGRHVLYVTWGEVIVANGLFDNQVVQLLLQLRRRDPATRITLLAGMPLVTRPLLQDAGRFRSELAEIRDRLAAAGIGFHVRWIPAMARWFHSSGYQFRLYLAGNTRFLRRFISRHAVDVVHCRSYHATRLALAARARSKRPYAILFDTRGLFPEESVFAGHFSVESDAYRRWKTEEKFLLENADAVVNVSDTFTEHIRSISSVRRVYTIPTSTDIAIFRPDAAGRRAARAGFGLQAEEEVLVYLGSIGIDSGWNRVANLIAAFRGFLTAFSSGKLLVITRSSHRRLQQEFDRIPELAGRVILTAASSPEETAGLLRAGDYAVLPFNDGLSAVEDLIGRTMIASKTGEYLATGLPMLVNARVGAAARLVAAHDLGCIYRPGEEADACAALRRKAEDDTTLQHRCRTLAVSYFSADVHARRYLEIYQMLAGGENRLTDEGAGNRLLPEAR